MSKRKTTQEFIQQAISIHPEYCYDKVDYTTAKNKVCIICPEHGEFLISPNNFLAGRKCPKCSAKSKSDKLSDSKETFIEKAKQINSNYDYSKIKYVNQHTKVIITCPIHGDFEITPNNLLQGKGCPKCYVESKLLTTQQFIDKAIKIHGDLYNYDKVEYKGTQIPVIIICKKHGEFLQTPNSHLRGRGCPYCNQSHGERVISNLLSQFNIKAIPQFKIGLENNTIRNYLLVDFYLPDQNLIIEYNGIQHYTPIEHFGGILKYNDQKSRDKILEKYCQDNNINLIVVPYTMNKTEIENLLTNVFRKNDTNSSYV